MISVLTIKKIFRRMSPLAAAAALLSTIVAGALAAAVPQSPQPPEAADKVFLEHADRLVRNDATRDETGEYQVLVGNVRMRKGGMVMTCDSAHFYDQINSFEAFGNVRMEQGDTLFVFGDRLFYDGPQEIATLSGDLGKKVRMVNRDVTLLTYVFYYDLVDEVGYYDNWGELSDPGNTLESIVGEYHTRTKDAWFSHNVELTERKPKNGQKPSRLVTDSLNYNTATHVATILAPAVITNPDGVIRTSSGTYNTETGQSRLYKRSTVLTNRGNTLIGDTLTFDRATGIGEAFGDVVITDSARQSSLHGNFGYYNDPLDSAFVTGRALAKEYSRGDTLFLHADTLNAYIEIDGTDSVRVTNAFHRVRFFRSDIQGICDSLSAASSDSILRMFRNPVIWSGERQVAGNVIYVHINDSVPDWSRLPEGGVMSEHIAEDCHNQLAGTDMTVWFNDSTVERLYVEGNVQMVMFPTENDSTCNKYVYLESSTMDAYFDGMNPRKINFWPETTYDIVPLYLAKRSGYTLQKFRDYTLLRPADPADVFIVPEEMIQLIDASSVSPKTTRTPTAKDLRPRPAARPAAHDVSDETISSDRSDESDEPDESEPQETPDN